MQELSPQQKRQLFSRLLVTFAVLLVFAAGMVAGTSMERRKSALDLTQFWNVYGLLQKEYIGTLDKDKAVEGATKGLVESLDDPYSSYLPADERKRLDEELSGRFDGIGAILSEKDRRTEIVELIPGSPAEKAGLKANDLILAVDDQPTEGLVLDEVVSKIRGPKDTTVTLLVERSGTDDPIVFKITRAKIQVKSVKSEMKGQVGYIDVSQFGDDTVEGVTEAVKSLKDKKAKAIILDLRNNPGGYLNSVPPIAGLFLPPSVIVKEKYKSGKTDSLRSTSVPILPDTPLFILVNDSSASASEILAGALQDYDRATLIGEKTYGKGSVQDIIPLYGSAALRLTIAEWLTPKDRAINKMGIEPDVVIEDKIEGTSDAVLEKALELANK
jgi:carboxyl-terminal processing protease